MFKVQKIDHTVRDTDRMMFDEYIDMAHRSRLSTGMDWLKNIISVSSSEMVRIFGSIISLTKDIAGHSAHSGEISERANSELQINFLSRYDLLTQLANRSQLIDLLQQALFSSKRSGKSGALLLIDLDNFKELNDTLGHETGDLLLVHVADRLKNSAREGDTVARMGGDEFVVMLEKLSGEVIDAASEAKQIGEKIWTILNMPYLLGTHEYSITFSIGVTLFGGQDATVDEILKQADIAMYQAKDAGRNSLQFFEPKLQEALNERVSLESELRHALEKQELTLYFQIQVDSGRSPVGAEALLRWIHPVRGLVPPLQFIDIAEKNGFILHIGLWVIDTACAQIKAWQQSVVTRELVLSVNVSARQFNQADFVEQVQGCVLRHGINPNLLKLELTESMFVNNISDIIEKFRALKMMGVQLSLDDFGTGYSSLQYLSKLPIHQIKIDQSFVRDLSNGNDGRALVRTIIAMADSMKFEVIAEGVETEDQLQLLLGKGCRCFQGYFFSKPVPITEFNALVLQLSSSEEAT
ncbi:MAG: hypothetical protein A2Z87_06300 [Gallionellales bacterium GWA2_54_124]|nr:MAG: hypothetical protein A2Z87_06300 [Gallionellales bacterium GWA2_54_124]